MKEFDRVNRAGVKGKTVSVWVPVLTRIRVELVTALNLPLSDAT